MKIRQKRMVLTLTALCLALVVAAGCTPKENNDKPTTTSGSATQTIAWSPEADCSTCHAAQDCKGNQPETTIGAIHEKQGVACVDCHETAEMEKVHEEHGDSGRTPTKLMYSEVSETSCLQSECHVSKDALAEKTANVTSIADKNGLVVNPHNLPASKTPGTGHDSIDCLDCHTVHEDSNIAESAKATCLECHHADVFECGTCHQ